MPPVEMQNSAGIASARCMNRARTADKCPDACSPGNSNNGTIQSGDPATSDEIGPLAWPDPWAVGLAAGPDRPERGECDRNECAERER